MMASTKTTGEILDFMGNHDNEFENGREIPKKIEELSFTDVGAKHNESIRKMLAPFANVHSEKLGCINAVKCRIELTPNSSPLRSGLNRAGPQVRVIEEFEVQKQLKTDLIEPTTSEWASLVLFVPKKKGSLAFCINYRHQNNVTIKETYPLPLIDVCIDSIGMPKNFSTLHANSGYWQIPVDEEDLDKTVWYVMQVYVGTSACPLV